ncbi:MAG: endonuclease domain-containing protein [bacterium]
MTKIYNLGSEKQKRKSLRNNMPKTEIILWSRLKNRQLKGYKFRRQYGIGKFVVDFYCPEIKLAIEIDGDEHFLSEKKIDYDKIRQEFLENFGVKFLRFQAVEIFKNLKGVLDVIYENLP